ncbi:MAG: hypothetical protein ACJ76J_31225, partial [Thermoanaerobaculia bacterium]
MLKIDRLRLSLPPGYEARAERIARLVADELASLPIQGDANLDRLTLPAVEVGPRATDRQVAGAIAGAMGSHLKDLKGEATGSAGVPPATNQVTSP